MEITICTYCNGFGYTEPMDRVGGVLVPVKHECKACEGSGRWIKKFTYKKFTPHKFNQA